MARGHLCVLFLLGAQIPFVTAFLGPHPWKNPTHPFPLAPHQSPYAYAIITPSLHAASATNDGQAVREAGADDALYGEWWAQASQLLWSAFPDMLPYSIPPGLDRNECVIKGEAVVVEAMAWRVPGKFRQIRAALVSTNATSPKVLNFVMFPEPCYDVPIFGADLVTLPGGHLAVLDFQPVVHPADDTYLQRYYTVLEEAFTTHSLTLGRPRLEDFPEAARPFFSPYCLFVRATSTDTMAKEVLPAFLDYLRAYLQLWAKEGGFKEEKEEEEEEEEEEGALAPALQGQLAYSRYRAEKDPARGMLTRMYGEEWTERFIHDLLFDLPRLQAITS